MEKSSLARGEVCCAGGGGGGEAGPVGVMKSASDEEEGEEACGVEGAPETVGVENSGLGDAVGCSRIWKLSGGGGASTSFCLVFFVLTFKVLAAFPKALDIFCCSERLLPPEDAEEEEGCVSEEESEGGGGWAGR